MNRLLRIAVAFAALVVVLVITVAIGARVEPSWSVSATRTSTASPQQIWAWYTDARDIPRWDHLVREVIVDGPFAAGTAGKNVPVQGPATPWTLTAVERDRQYTEISTLPLATLEATHVLTRVGAGTKIDHALTMRGPLAWVYGLLLRDSFAHGIVAALDRLADGAPHGLPR